VAVSVLQVEALLCSKHVEQILSVINIISDIKLVSNSSTINKHC